MLIVIQVSDHFDYGNVLYYNEVNEVNYHISHKDIQIMYKVENKFTVFDQLQIESLSVAYVDMIYIICACTFFIHDAYNNLICTCDHDDIYMLTFVKKLQYMISYSYMIIHN